MDRKIEGYWWSEHTPEYPRPVPNVLTKAQGVFYCAVIQTIQNDRRKCKQIFYKGQAVSRITGKSLGWDEYITSEFIWPGAYAKHYVRDHLCRPSDTFIEFLMKYVRDMKDKHLQGYFIDGFKRHQLKKIEPKVQEESGMSSWDKYIDACYELIKLKKPMREAIREVANCNNIGVGELAREMNRRSQITRRAKKARENHVKGITNDKSKI